MKIIGDPIRPVLSGRRAPRIFPALCALLLLGWFNAAVAEQINLFVGQVKVMQTGQVTRVAVGNGKLISTTILQNGQLIVLAEAAGETDMHIWRRDGGEGHYKVVIAKNDTSGQTHQIKELLGAIPGISVQQVGDFTAWVADEEDRPSRREHRVELARHDQSFQLRQERDQVHVRQGQGDR